MVALRKALAVVLAVATLPAAIPSTTTAQTPPAPGVIRGSLVDVDGMPLSGYQIKVTDAAGKVYESAPTGPDGKFEIGGLPAGSYTFMILDPEGKTVEVRLPPVTLEAGKMVTSPIQLVPRKGSRRKGPLIAWLVGGGAAVAALALAGGSNSNDSHNNPPMTSTAAHPGDGL